VVDGYRPVDVAALAETAERFYVDVSAELKLDRVAADQDPILVSFKPRPDQPCPPRGATLNVEPGPRITLFIDRQTSQVEIEGILAHEIAHALHQRALGPGYFGSMALTEGLASWAARESYADWQEVASLSAAVQDDLAAGRYVPLDEIDLGSVGPGRSVAPAGDGRQPVDCLARRDQYYTQWAAFVGYLIEREGWERFLDLLASAAPEVGEGGEIVPQAPDYEGVYGQSLDELEAEWLVTLAANYSGLAGP